MQHLVFVGVRHGSIRPSLLFRFNPLGQKIILLLYIANHLVAFLLASFKTVQQYAQRNQQEKNDKRQYCQAQLLL